MSLVWDHYPEGGGELLTALAYADHAHDDGSAVRPSVAYIARKTRQSERTVQRYLANMRKSTWLLPVKPANRWRGFATEYRVNPLWISHPDILSSREKNVRDEVTPEVNGDDTKGMNRTTPVSSQPSLTIKEPTTTVSPQFDCNGTPGSSLCWPVVFQGPSEVSATRILDTCPSADRQSVLDEVAALVERQSVRFPLGLLKKLVELAAKGLFIPSAGIAYRKKKNETRFSADQLKPGETQSTTPEVKREVLIRLASLREEFAGKGREGKPAPKAKVAGRTRWRSSG